MNDLFDEWKDKDNHKGKLFIKDGIVDKKKWSESKSKILFLLKEAYHSEQSSGVWDVTAFIKKKGVWGRTYKPMAQWAYGVNGVFVKNRILPFESSGNDVKDSLLSSAVVNIKKSNGKKASSDKDLSEYVDKDWDLIHKQIRDISPKIVICGSTFGLIKDKLLGLKKISDMAYLVDGVVYINFWHPSNRASNRMNYYALCSVVDLALNAKKNL